MGRIGRTYASERVYASDDCRNNAAAYRRFHSSDFLDRRGVIIAVMRHKATGGVIALMIALGFVGWLFTFS